MGGVPNIFERSHGLRGGGNTLLDVVIIAQAKGDEGAKVLEVATEGDITIFNLDGLRFIQLVVQFLLSFSARSFLLLRLSFVVGE